MVQWMPRTRSDYAAVATGLLFGLVAWWTFDYARSARDVASIAETKADSALTVARTSVTTAARTAAAAPPVVQVGTKMTMICDVVENGGAENGQKVSCEIIVVANPREP